MLLVTEIGMRGRITWGAELDDRFAVRHNNLFVPLLRTIGLDAAPRRHMCARARSPVVVLVVADLTELRSRLRRSAARRERAEEHGQKDPGAHVEDGGHSAKTDKWVCRDPE